MKMEQRNCYTWHKMPNHTLQMTNSFYTIQWLYHQFTRTQPFVFFNGPAKYTQHTLCMLYIVHGMHKKLHSFTTFAIILRCINDSLLKPHSNTIQRYKSKYKRPGMYLNCRKTWRNSDHNHRRYMYMYIHN